VPYLRLLERLLASVPGALAALLLDSNGEVVVEAGPRVERDRHRLIGAYQGLALSTARQATERYDVGRIRCLVFRYQTGTLVLRPLRDGYYLVMSLGPEAGLGRGMHFAAEIGVDLDAEL
jgi:predicted regulator of Ras-like GTPase activity (Roadblock/LC7/MglB family)